MIAGTLRRRIRDFAAGVCLGSSATAALSVSWSDLLGQLNPPDSPSDQHASQTDHGAIAPSSAPEARAVPAPASLSQSWRRFCKWGLPSADNVQLKRDYCCSVNFRTRIPNWVAEHLTQRPDGEGVSRKQSRFAAEAAVPEIWRASNEDYRGTRWSRGHLAPASAHKASQEALDETFLLSSNIVPQELSNNGSDWLRLERYAKDLLRSYSDVYIISGPLFLPSQEADGTQVVRYPIIGKHNVSVPTHLFKVICAENAASGERRLSAFVLPNGPVRGHAPLDDFVVPLSRVEEQSGLALFAELPNRDKLKPLCGGPSKSDKCGVGHLDGRIEGWKLLGHLKLSRDCDELTRAWSEVESKAGRIDVMPVMQKEMQHASSNLSCAWEPPPRPKRGASHSSSDAGGD